MIELLVVIGIITLLMAALFAYAGKLRERARMASARRLLESVATAIEAYKMDFKQYPPSTFGAYNGDEALTYLLTTPFRSNPNPAKGEVAASINAGPYLQLQPIELVDVSGAGRLSIIDAWRTPIYYQLVQQKDYSVWDTSQTASFQYIYIPVMYSCGPDKISETIVDPITRADDQIRVL